MFHSNVQTLQPTLLPNTDWSDILNNIDDLSNYRATKTTALEKKQLGQIFTPLEMARQLISLVKDFNPNEAYGDPGTGTGILSASLLARHAIESVKPPTSLAGYEADTRLHSDWDQNFSDICYKLGMPKSNVTVSTDFYKEAHSILTTGRPSNGKKVTKLVTNPPYNKLASTSEISILLKEHGIHAPNHYAAFIALSVEWLENDGDLLAIIPRSFFSGRYFKRFRNWLSSKMSIEHIVAYNSRSNFGKQNVLQENVCISLKKCAQKKMIRVSFCENASSTATHDLLIPSDVVLGDLWKLPAKPQQLEALSNNAQRVQTLASLGLTIKTGAVEVHRAQCTASEAVTVFYSRDFDASGNITWGESKKPRHFAYGRGSYQLPSTGGGFVVIKRITANDGDKDRILPTWVSNESTGLSQISFDNHVQVFSFNDKPMSKQVGLSLIRFLQSKEANLCMSAISGTTQINLDDLNELNYPNIFV